MVEISIIVPIYNVEEYLESCIESILNQTFKSFELILVDDGSTDKSGEICDKYEEIDSRIKVIHKNNGGLSSARNAGLDIACGKYIGFVDSDDTIHPKMYEILYDLIKKYKVDMSFCNFKRTYEIFNKEHQEIKVMEVTEMNNIEAINSLYDKEIGVNLVIACNKLYNKRLFNDIRYEIGRIHEDEFIAHRILYKCKKIAYTNNELYYYLQRQGSIMSGISYKRKVDSFLAQSDRMRFFRKEGLMDMCNYISKMYEYNFFTLYREIDKNINSQAELLNELRKDFISSLNILLGLENYTTKEKINWIIFAISPRIYKLISNLRKYKNYNTKESDN